VNLITAAIEILRSVLLSDATIRSKVGTRVYGAELFEVKNPSYPCVNLKRTPSTTEPRIRELRTSYVRFWVWSKESLDEAAEIYDLIEAKLKGSRFTKSIGGYTYSIVCDSDSEPIDTTDPEAGLYAMVGDFEVKLVRYS